jgi:hypothetical protein
MRPGPRKRHPQGTVAERIRFLRDRTLDAAHHVVAEPPAPLPGAAAEAPRGFSMEHVPAVAAIEEWLERSEAVTVGDVNEILGIDPLPASQVVSTAPEAVTCSAWRARPTAGASAWNSPTRREIVEHAHRTRQALWARLLADWSEQDKATFARLLTRGATTAQADDLCSPGGRPSSRHHAVAPGRPDRDRRARSRHCGHPADPRGGRGPPPRSRCHAASSSRSPEAVAPSAPLHSRGLRPAESP